MGSAIVGKEGNRMNLNDLRDAIYGDAVAHGLWDLEERGLKMSIECQMLIENEVNELFDAAHQGKERYTEELADVVIMSLSVAGKLGIDIDAAVRRKMEINKGRPWKHGK